MNANTERTHNRIMLLASMEPWPLSMETWQSILDFVCPPDPNPVA
jgi:hypothetical protein